MAIEYTHMGFMKIDEVESEAETRSIRNLETTLKDKIASGKLVGENLEGAKYVLERIAHNFPSD
ncbi:hypothetical protein HY448_01000 [Candidatus Pacearchaeota archaeon]|nr:hypothetical protein [Candidatus Pacearchaeota archaeon]